MADNPGPSYTCDYQRHLDGLLNYPLLVSHILLDLETLKPKPFLISDRYYAINRAFNSLDGGNMHDLVQMMSEVGTECRVCFP